MDSILEEFEILKENIPKIKDKTKIIEEIDKIMNNILNIIDNMNNEKYHHLFENMKEIEII